MRTQRAHRQSWWLRLVLTLLVGGTGGGVATPWNDMGSDTNYRLGKGESITSTELAMRQLQLVGHIVKRGLPPRVPNCHFLLPPSGCRDIPAGESDGGE